MIFARVEVKGIFWSELSILVTLTYVKVRASLRGQSVVWAVGGVECNFGTEHADKRL
jgi:hypothetical protein